MATLEKLGGLWWGRLGIDRPGGCSRGGFHFSATVPPREGFQCSHLVPPSRSSPGSAAAAAAAAVACCRLCWVGRKLRLPVCLRRFFFFFACVSSSCCSISADHSSDGAAAALAICSSSDVVRSPVVAFRFLPCPSTDGCPTPAVAPFPPVCGPIPAPVPAVTVCSAARSSCCSAAAPSVGAASTCPVSLLQCPHKAVRLRGDVPLPSPASSSHRARNARPTLRDVPGRDVGGAVGGRSPGPLRSSCSITGIVSSAVGRP